jgi:hypothetical protein
MLDASFIEKIVSLAEVSGIEVDGRNYTTAKIYPNLEPEATPLKMHTLSGLVDFCLDFAAQVGERTIVHVVSDQQVDVVSPLFGPFKQREKFATASPFQLSHKFDRYMPVEEFVIYLQSMFIQDQTALDILKVVGNLTQGSETNVADDGITQRVTAKAGVARVAVVDLPNPVALRPYRTFMDIQQPASEFVLRIKADKDEGPRCALFEADGGAWRNTAVETIKGYMTDNLNPDQAIIIA